MKKWQCSVCKYIHEGDEPPEKCPVCGVPASRFVLLEEPEEKEKQEKAAEPAVEKVAPELKAEPEPEHLKIFMKRSPG